jgi:DMSO/TMAO reductase YedYZ molybdopterin-dependent catalytic subunit
MSDAILRVSGLCAGAELSWADLDLLAEGAALVDETERLSPKVRGQGVRLSAVLVVAQPAPAATHAVVHDDGEYRACLPLADAGLAVLAHRLDGGPLPDELGGPLRLLVPTSDNACLSVKRVTRVELTDHAEVDTVPKPTYSLRRP